MKYRKLLLLGVSFSVQCLLTLCISTSVRAETPWEKYLNLPTEENADSVHEVAWSSKDADVGMGERILALQIEGGSAAALRLAIRLSDTDDASFREDLHSIIGDAIRAQPSIFVTQMAACHLTSSQVKTILVRAGPAYVDRPTAQLFELEKRRDAIASLRLAEPKGVEFQSLALEILASEIADERAALAKK